MEEDSKIWQRMIKRRRNSCQGLGEGKLEELLSDFWGQEDALSHSVPCNATTKLEKLLMFHLDICSDETKTASRRRKSLDSVKTVLRKVDEAVCDSNDGKPSPSSVLAQRATGNKETNSSLPRTRSVSSSPVNGACDSSFPIESGLSETTSVSEPAASGKASDLRDCEVNGVGKHSLENGISQPNAVTSELSRNPVRPNANKYASPSEAPRVVHATSENGENDFSYSSLINSVPMRRSFVRANGTNLNEAQNNGSYPHQYPFHSNDASSHGLGERNKRFRPTDDQSAFIQQTNDKTWQCLLCKVYRMQESSVRDHIMGKRHTSALAAFHDKNQGENYPPQHHSVSNFDAQSRPIPQTSGRSANQSSHLNYYQPSQGEFLPPKGSSVRSSSDGSSFYNQRQQQHPMPNNGNLMINGGSSLLLPIESAHRASSLPFSSMQTSAFGQKWPATNSGEDRRRSGSSGVARVPDKSLVPPSTSEISIGVQVTNVAKSHLGNFDQVSIETGSKRSTRNNLQLAEGPAVTIIANKDPVPTVARALVGRKRTEVNFRPVVIDADTEAQVRLRLKEWDPFWKNVEFLAVGATAKAVKLNPQPDLTKEYEIQRVAECELVLSEYEQIEALCLNWGKQSRQNSTTILLRMLPINLDYYKKKRADCHLWAKGTFLQVDNETIQLFQRRQQEHDRTLWKGMCKDLDLIEHIANPNKKHKISIFTCDKDSYAYAIAICQYQTVDTLFNNLMSSDHPDSITKLSREEGMNKALQFAGGQMLVIDSDDEKDTENVGKFVFCLTCPISKQPMKTPVRGKSCKHFQCFDLKNFISSNEVVGGSRWRCANCESFVSLQNLEYCGLTASLLQEFEGVATAELDRVELCSDRSYRLLGERKPRYKGKGSFNNDKNSLAEGKGLQEHIVIDLL